MKKPEMAMATAKRIHCAGLNMRLAG
ncbi:MAG: hypothetical protein RI923_905, partial [Pseudomonadota bacterium]